MLLPDNVASCKKVPNMVIPSCAGWFDYNEIHEIEMRELPEFFCGRYPYKNPTMYKEYRNTVIKLYRENPQ
jgi:SWI/SNF related-matrix-associated actin-dependent regulator of chromatin subfamily C